MRRGGDEDGALGNARSRAANDRGGSTCSAVGGYSVAILLSLVLPRHCGLSLCSSDRGVDTGEDIISQWPSGGVEQHLRRTKVNYSATFKPLNREALAFVSCRSTGHKQNKINILLPVI